MSKLTSAQKTSLKLKKAVAHAAVNAAAPKNAGWLERRRVYKQILNQMIEKDPAFNNKL